MFERILVALDGSPNAQHALERAVVLAKGTGTRVLGLVHVRPSIHSMAYAYGYPAVAGPPGWSFAEQLADSMRQAEERSRELLEAAEAYVRSQGLIDIKVVQHAEEGQVVPAIIDVVGEGAYDLLVMGSRGMGRAAGLLLGSVSQSVTANLPCSVLIVDTDADEQDAELNGELNGRQADGRGGEQGGDTAPSGMTGD